MRRPDTQLDAPIERKTFAAAAVGNLLEIYDFIAYGIFAVPISRTFFATHSEFISLLLTFVTFAVGFVARPVGTLVLGRYADRVGRRHARDHHVRTLVAGLFSRRRGRRLGGDAGRERAGIAQRFCVLVPADVARRPRATRGPRRTRTHQPFYRRTDQRRRMAYCVRPPDRAGGLVYPPLDSGDARLRDSQARRRSAALADARGTSLAPARRCRDHGVLDCRDLRVELLRPMRCASCT